MENLSKDHQGVPEKENSGLEGTATHSGWMHFYSAYSKYRDECIRLGKEVLGNNLNVAIQALSAYHSALYSMAQQVFSFYEESFEDELTEQWLDLGEKVDDFLIKVNDRDFRNQMYIEGQTGLDRELKVSLLKYFNKVDRMAADAGLHVGKENRGDGEPKKGLLAFKRK